MSDAHAVTRDQLRSFIERIERLEEEKKTIADDIKDVYGEAKGVGFDTKVLRKLISIRKQDRDERAEQEAILDMYMIALGMVDEPAGYDEPHQSAPVQRQPAMALRSDGGLSILTKHEDITNGDRSNERDSQQHVGRTDDEQHDAPPVPCPDGRGEGADAGAEGQGAGASGADRNGRPVAGTVDCQDEDGRGRHVGGEARYEVIQPETAEELQHPVPHATGANARSGGDGSTVRGARTEADAVTAGETAPHSQSDDDAFAEVKGRARLANADGVETSSSGHPSDQPNGDSNEVATSGALRAGLADPTSNTGEGAASALPAKPKVSYRPNCQHPENCASGTRDHCWSCRRAMQKSEEMA